MSEPCSYCGAKLSRPYYRDRSGDCCCRPATGCAEKRVRGERARQTLTLARAIGVRPGSLEAAARRAGISTERAAQRIARREEQRRAARRAVAKANYSYEYARSIARSRGRRLAEMAPADIVEMLQVHRADARATRARCMTEHRRPGGRTPLGDQSVAALAGKLGISRSRLWVLARRSGRTSREMSAFLVATGWRKGDGVVAGKPRSDPGRTRLRIRGVTLSLRGWAGLLGERLSTLLRSAREHRRTPEQEIERRLPAARAASLTAKEAA